MILCLLQEGDDDEVAMLRPLLARTQLEKVPLRCVCAGDIHEGVLHLCDGLCVATCMTRTY